MSGEAEMIGALHKVLDEAQDESGERLRRPEDAHESASHLTQRRHSEIVVQPSANDTHFQLPLCDEFPRSVNWKNKRVAAILETAASCFSRGGFTSTTLADIGRELGLRKSIVHYYFASSLPLYERCKASLMGTSSIRFAVH